MAKFPWWAWAVVLAILAKVVREAKLPMDMEMIREQIDTSCQEGMYTSEKFFRISGFVKIPGFVRERDLRVLVEDIEKIPKGVRYVCGASDLQPDECKMNKTELWRRFPRMMANFTKLAKRWRRTGVSADLNLLKWGKLEAKGGEYIAINAWAFPWSLLKGRWEYVMGFTGLSSDAVSSLKGYLTMRTEIPIYTGYHGWHVDGDAPKSTRFHKLFVMVSKEDNNGTLRRHSNLRLIPNHHWELADRLEVRQREQYPLMTSLFGTDITVRSDTDVDRELLGCTVTLDPGDALFFRENVLHRTQDMEASRFSLILDIQ